MKHIVKLVFGNIRLSEQPVFPLFFKWYKHRKLLQLVFYGYKVFYFILSQYELTFVCLSIKVLNFKFNLVILLFHQVTFRKTEIFQHRLRFRENISNFILERSIIVNPSILILKTINFIQCMIIFQEVIYLFLRIIAVFYAF